MISKNLHEAEQYLLGTDASGSSQQNEIANARYLISSRFKIMRELMKQREQKVAAKAKAFEIIKISSKIKDEINQTDILIGKLETLVHGKISKAEKHILSRIKKKEKAQLKNENELQEKQGESNEMTIEKEQELLEAKRKQYESLIEKLRMVWTKFNNIERDEGRSGEGVSRAPGRRVESSEPGNIFTRCVRS